MIAILSFVIALAGFHPSFGAGIQQLDQWKTVNSAYLTTLNTGYGLLLPGVASTTSGCLSIASNGWVSPSGSACGSGSGGSTFSTTSTDYWKTQNNFFSTTSADYWVGLKNYLTGVTADSPLSGSGTSGSHLVIQNSSGSQTGALTSTDWNAFNARLSTTTLGLFDKGYFFSTTSANFWSSVGLAYSTTSSDYWWGTRFPFTPSATGFYNQLANSTTTQIHFGGAPTSISASSTAVFQAIVAGYATTTYASTTALTVPDAYITRLANLATNGFVKTGGLVGTLSIDTNTYLTANQSITLTGAVTGSGATAITTAFGTAAANTVLANGTGATAVPTFTATSSLFNNAASAVTGLMSSVDWSLLHTATTTFSAPLVWTASTNAVTCTSATASVTGCLSGTDWTRFNQSVATTSIDTIGELETLWGSINIIAATEIDTCSELAAIMTGETGTCGSWVLSVDPTFTGTLTFAKMTGTNATTTTLFATYASTTYATSTYHFISQATIQNASTTLETISTALYLPNAYFNGSRMGVGTTSPSALWGFVVATTTMVQNAQFGITIASSTANLPTVLINWNGTTTAMAGNHFRYILQQNTIFILNSTSSYPLDGGRYITSFCQDGTGSRTPTWATPGSIIWDTPEGTTTIKATANTMTSIAWWYDGRVGRYHAVATSTSADPRACVQ